MVADRHADSQVQRSSKEMGKTQASVKASEWDNWDDVPPVKAGIGDVIKWESIGQSMVGKYEGKIEVPEATDPKTGEIPTAHTFTDRDGKALASWSTFDLDRKMAEVPPGSIVHIEFAGLVEVKGRPEPMKSFTVKYRF